MQIVHAVHTLAAFEAALAPRPAAVAIIDPLVLAPGDTDRVALILERRRPAQAIVYTSLDPAAMRAYELLAAHAVRDLALWDVDDDIDDFARWFDPDVARDAD